MHTAQVVVIGQVTAASNTTATLAPEAFLKGAATTDPISLRNDEPGTECNAPNFKTGQRVLVIVEVDAAGHFWAQEGGAFELKSGQATVIGDGSDLTEAELVQQIRKQTNQYAVPAQTKSEGAGINWTKTVLPVGAALLLVFGIGLWLMKIWHRIDPT